MKIRHFFALMLIILISAPLVSQDGNSETTAYLTVDMVVELKGKSSAKVTAQVLSSELMDSHNSFAQPEEVVPVAFDGARYKKGKLELSIPARSVIVLQLD